MGKHFTHMVVHCSMHVRVYVLADLGLGQVPAAEGQPGQPGQKAQVAPPCEQIHLRCC